jgi:two-component system, sensor histidine kinase YesM
MHFNTSLTYGNKLLLYAVLLTVTVIFTIFFTSKNLVTKLLMERQLEYELNSSLQAGKYMSTFFENVDSWVQIIQNNSDIINNMTRGYNNEDFREIKGIIRRIDSNISNIIADTQYIDKVILLGENNLAYIRDFILTSGYYLGDGFKLSKLMESDFIQPLLDNSTKPFYYTAEPSVKGIDTGLNQIIGEINNKILFTDFIKGKDNKIMGMIIISLKEDMAAKVFSYAEEPEIYYLTDTSRSLIWSNQSNEGVLPQPVMDLDGESFAYDMYTIEGKKYYVGLYHLSPHNFYLFKQIPVAAILEDMPLIHRFGIISGVVCLLIVSALSVFLSKKYAEPLTEMVQGFRKNSGEGFTPFNIDSKIPLPKLTISKKIIVFFVIAVGIPNFLFISSVIYSSYQVYENKIMALTISTLKQVRWNVEYKLESYDNISKRLIYMDEVQNILRNEGYQYSTAEYTGLEQELVAVKLSERDILSIGFFDRLGEVFVVNDYFGSAVDSSIDDTVMSAINRGRDRLVILSENIGQPGNVPVISLGRNIRSSNEADFGKKIGYFILSIDRNVLNDMLFNTHTESSGYIFLVDDNGKTVANYNNAYTGFSFDDMENMKQKKYRIKDNVFLGGPTEDHIVFNEPLPRYGLKLIGALPVYKLTSSLYPLLWYSTLLLLVYLTAIGVFTTAVASIIAKPITRLKILLENLDSDYHRHADEYRGRDEIAILSVEYNKLISRLDELIYENYQANLRESELMFLEKEAQLNALQQQINPHFLYNTLESIKWMAYKQGDREVCEMAAALGSFFRGAVSTKKELVTFKDEIEHLENYIYIQRIRYNNKFDVTIQFDDEVKEYLTVKLVLQPLVENSIVHGMEEIESNGLIRLEGKRTGDRVRVIIQDNGTGIDKLNLQRIKNQISGLTPENTSSSIGLSNVYRRLKLYFGSKCRFDIHSVKGGGTTIQLEIPAVVSIPNA